MKRKYVREVLHLEDAHENNQRLERVREERKKEYEEKIQLEAMRSAQI